MSMMGSRVTAKPSQVRMFLRAGSAEELVRLQLQTNVRLQGRADFTDFQNVDGDWYCWFLVDVDNEGMKLFEELNGSKSDAV